MEVRREHCLAFWSLKLLYYFTLLPPLLLHCDAIRPRLQSQDTTNPKNPNLINHLQILDLAKNLNMVMDVSIVKDSYTPDPYYVSSPLTLPPYDSLPPIPLTDTSPPPFCVYPPPQTPTIPSPTQSSPNPPSSPTGPILTPPLGPLENPPPPYTVLPGPTTPTPSPYTPVPNPPYYEPSPPSGGGGGTVPSPFVYVPSPVGYVPSPTGFAPSPPVFEPPVVYPPPITLTPPSTGGSGGGFGGGGGGGFGGGGGGGGGQSYWCVAKPSVPDPILQEAMNYACGSGADCGPIQPNGPCYQPNSVVAHASYAFNSYWQRTKVAGGTCGFGGIAMLVTVDPSPQGCHFIRN